MPIHKLFLEVYMVWQSSGDIFVDIMEHLLVSFLVHEIQHELFDILLILNDVLRLFTR